MLKELRIHNIILVEEAIIPFGTGFNVISGETGSGKSAVIEALSLLSGGRGDSSLIRNGADKGAVEGLFDISKNSDLLKTLAEAGIHHDLGEDLIIRREIAASGRGRIFVNNQAAQLHFIKAIGELLVDSVGQHASQRLLSIEQHRQILDCFGELSPHLSSFRAHWEEENRLRLRLQTLRSSEAQRLRDIEVCRIELEELTNAQLKEGEEEELFDEFTLLSNAEERRKKVHLVHGILSGDKNNIVGILNQYNRHMDDLVEMDPDMRDNRQTFKSALVELTEVAYNLQRYLHGIASSPDRLANVNERLTLLNRLKRKYGGTLSEAIAYMHDTQARLTLLENADNEIETIEQALQEQERQTHAHAAALTAERQKAASRLEKELLGHLRELNMPHAIFTVVFTSLKRSAYGDEKVEFYLAPNIGEKQISVKECASGGELSRLMLSIQALLAGKERIPTLIFDEIDANIGGETASIVGEKLLAIGGGHQVICITHFPQVAEFAQHHFQIEKVVHEERTRTIVNVLDKKTRKVEMERMRGIKSAAKPRL